MARWRDSWWWQTLKGGLVAMGALVVVFGLPFLSDSCCNRRIREGQPPMRCASNLRQIGLAIKMYAADNEEAYPPDFGALYPVYVDTPKLFSCAETPSPWERIRETGKVRPAYTSYVYVAGLDDTDKSACVLAYDRPGNHGERGVFVVYIDRNVEWVPSFEQLAELLEKTRELAAANGREVELVGE